MEKVKADKQSASLLPETSGVYVFEKGKRVLYVGKAKNLRNRVKSYFLKNLELKTRKMVSNSETISYISVKSEFEALLLEANLVSKYKPKYNIELKDDKSPLYIGITREDFPRILTLRQTQLEKFDLKYIFGPFTNATAPKKVLRRLRRAVPYSTHKQGVRTCVLHQIGLCSPCPTKRSTSEEKRAYGKNILKIKSILSGNIKKVLVDLNRQMNKYSRSLDFEKARDLQKQIQNLEYLTEDREDVGEYLKNPNLLSDIRKRELKEFKKLINEFFELKSLNRIECFDVAHLAGSYPTASMVTFIGGEPEKNFYRQFAIRQNKSNDDLSSMREVLSRRRRHFESWGKPDLIIIDGGKGQIGTAREILPDIPIVGLAKRHETLVFWDKESYHERRVPKGPARNLVQRIRNEAHRFARRYHHKLVSRAIRESAKK